jgi:miniconductance mechanosensitive channel
MKESIINWIRSLYFIQNENGRIFDEIIYENHSPYWAIGLFICLIITVYVLWLISRFILAKLVIAFVDKTTITWDDYFVKYKVFRSLANLVPLLLMEYFLSIVFYQYPLINSYCLRFAHLLIVFVIMISVNRCLSAFRDIIQENIRYQDKPIQSYFQIAKITSTCIFIIMMLSVLTDQTPMFFVTSLGAMTAIVALVFKDTILGFISSLQLSSNDMVRIGDWITMDKFGADGDVIEINVSSVKIRNFDKTISSIPTYSFISDSFKNWRGMKESDGRRIKRSISLQIDSIAFASPELLERLRKVKIIKEFIIEREQEIEKYNKEFGFKDDDELNGRRQTNIGLFRRYIEFYIRYNPHINKEMTIMIRQLEAKETGVPIEVYCFTKVKEFEPYEAIVADIFDHIFAVTHLFELRIFENPSGHDFRLKN